MWINVIIGILTSKPFRRVAAVVVRAGVKSTKTKFDDRLAAPALLYLDS